MENIGRTDAAERLFGERVATLRQQRGLTQQALADLCAVFGRPVSRGLIAKVETAQRPTSVAELAVIAHALSVSPSDLLVETEEYAEVLEATEVAARAAAALQQARADLDAATERVKVCEAVAARTSADADEITRRYAELLNQQATRKREG